MIQTTTARRPRPRRWLYVIGTVIVILPIGWYLGSPLFLNKSVSESFPMSAGATIPQGMTKQQVENEMMQASKASTTASESMPATETAAKASWRGAFTEVDAVHKAKGTATVYRVGNELVLRLDPFESANGPDLYVYLSRQAVPRSSAQVHEGGSVEVARLKGNIGGQNYTLPADLDLSKYKSVVIYCRRFHVVFSTAELTTL